MANQRTDTKGATVKVTLMKSPVGFNRNQLAVVRGLGLRRVLKRGFHNPFRVEYEVVNLDTLAARFETGTVVTPELLVERGLVSGREALVKVLARGEVAKALTVHAHKFSGKAAEKIAAAG